MDQSSGRRDKERYYLREVSEMRESLELGDGMNMGDERREE